MQISWVGWSTKLHLADYPAMSFFFVCWHSRKWWPPIRGGTLQMLVLWPEKLNQIDSFCKSLILYAWGGPRSIERCKKHGAPPKKTVFPRPICHFLSLSWKVAATNGDKPRIQWNKQVFFVGFLSFSSHFLLPESLYVHDTDILKRHRSRFAFSGFRDHWYKVPPLHRGHHRQLNK